MPNRDEEHYEEVHADQCPYCYTRGLDPKATRCPHCCGEWEDYVEDEEDEADDEEEELEEFIDDEEDEYEFDDEEVEEDEADDEEDEVDKKKSDDEEAGWAFVALLAMGVFLGYVLFEVGWRWIIFSAIWQMLLPPLFKRLWRRND